MKGVCVNERWQRIIGVLALVWLGVSLAPAQLARLVKDINTQVKE